MPLYALVRDDTGESLTIDGLLTINERRESRWTSHEVADLSQASDGRIQTPLVLSLQVIASPGSMDDSVTTGPARLEEVADFLRRWDNDAALCSFQAPDADAVTSLGLEAYPWTQSDTDARFYDLTMKQIRVASSQSVAIAAGDGEQPRADIAPGQADEADLGTRAPKQRRSLPAAFLGGR